MVLTCAACGHASVQASATSASPRPAAPSPSPSASASVPSTPPCDAPDGFSCDDHARFAAAEKYIDGRPGVIGFVVRDRQTGAVFRSRNGTYKVWTASTVKLAIATYLLEEQAAGEITLSSSDKSLMSSMLRVSDDHAADVLWKRAGGPRQVPTWRSRYGMSGVTFVDGFDRYWGYMKCSPSDLDHLMSYVLGRTSPDIRSYLVGKLRSVGANQQWGVWAGADQSADPGNKNGWSQEHDDGTLHWVINTVGFAGRDERWQVAIMYRLRPSGTYDQGVAAVTQVAKLLLSGKR